LSTRSAISSSRPGGDLFGSLAGELAAQHAAGESRRARSAIAAARAGPGCGIFGGDARAPRRRMAASTIRRASGRRTAPCEGAARPGRSTPGPAPLGGRSGGLFLIAAGAHDLRRQQASAHLILDLARISLFCWR